MLPFADSMYPDRVLVRKDAGSISPQGGYRPSPGVGTWYPASVQWKAQAALEANPETPLARTDAVVLIPRGGADPAISGLVVGDQVDIREGGDVTVATVQDTPVGATDPYVVWEFPVKAVQGG